MPDDQTYTMTPEQFMEAVRLAVTALNKRLMLMAFVAGLLSAAFIALPVVFFTAKANCNSVKTLAEADKLGFAEEKANNKSFVERSKDRLGLSESDFQKLILSGELRAQRKIDAATRVERRNCALI